MVEASGVLAHAGLQTLRAALLAFAVEPRSQAEIVDFLEDWVAAKGSSLDAAELAHQRTYKWRPILRWHALVRAPSARKPSVLMAAPTPPEEWPDAQTALRDVARWHLRAFGPAAAEDVAQWLGFKTPPVRAALEAMNLAVFADERGRRLYDLPDAPRPDADTPAPPRLLPWFDNVVLAYAPGNRGRILPDAYKDRAYQRANLQWLPLVLVDGMVAGTWAPKTGLNPFVKLPAAVASELRALLADCPA